MAPCTTFQSRRGGYVECPCGWGPTDAEAGPRLRCLAASCLHARADSESGTSTGGRRACMHAQEAETAEALAMAATPARSHRWGP